MQRSSQHGYISGRSAASQSILGRAVAFIVGLGVLGVSIFVGALFLAAVIGFVLITGLVVMARVWWVKRKMQQYQREHGDIEGEYRVVEHDDRRG